MNACIVFLFIFLVSINGQIINCSDIGQSEIYYTNAGDVFLDFNGWTTSTKYHDTTRIASNSTRCQILSDDDKYCFEAIDSNIYGENDNMSAQYNSYPEITSSEISTDGYYNIQIIFYVYLSSSYQSTCVTSNCAGECITSYSVSSPTNFTLINTFSSPQDTLQFVRQPLGTDAANIANLQIKFKVDGIHDAVNSQVSCNFDEIRICGTSYTIFYDAMDTSVNTGWSFVGTYELYDWCPYVGCIGYAIRISSGSIMYRSFYDVDKLYALEFSFRLSCYQCVVEYKYDNQANYIELYSYYKTGSNPVDLSVSRQLDDPNGANTVTVRFINEYVYSDLYINNFRFKAVSLPTPFPTFAPIMLPTLAPSETSTLTPTLSTTDPTKSPTTYPTMSPSTYPTETPTQSTLNPTQSPTDFTTEPSNSPSNYPTKWPTYSPTLSTSDPTYSPSTKSPTLVPTKSPTTNPSTSPTLSAKFVKYSESVKDLEAKYQILLIVFVSACAVIAFFAWIDSKCRTNDYFKISQISGTLFQTLDMLSDCFFAVNISYQNKLNSDYFIPLLLSIFFIIFPASITVIQLYYHSKKHWIYKSSDQVRGWMAKQTKALYLLSIITGNAFAAISLVNSYMFQMSFFDMGLTEKEIQAFTYKRVYSVILLENIPQLGIQVWYLVSLGVFDDPITISSIIFSLISIIVSIFSMSIQKNLSQTEGYVSVTIQVTGNEVTSKSKNCKTMKRKLEKKLAEIVIIHDSRVQVIRPIAIKQGFQLNVNIYYLDVGKAPNDYYKEIVEAQKNGDLQMAFKEGWKLEEMPVINIIDHDMIQSKEEKKRVEVRNNLVNTQSNVEMVKDKINDEGEAVDGDTQTVNVKYVKVQKHDEETLDVENK